MEFLRIRVTILNYLPTPFLEPFVAFDRLRQRAKSLQQMAVLDGNRSPISSVASSKRQVRRLCYVQFIVLMAPAA